MSQQSSGFKVLVVDDDRDFAVCVREGLALDGCDVRIAHSGGDALLHAKAFAPDAVLLDLSLPDRKAYDIADDMRRGGLDKHTAIVILTGAPARDLPSNDPPSIDMTLTKPVDLALLGSLLRHLHGIRQRGASGGRVTR